MSVRGWAMSAAWVRQGSELTADVAAGALVLPVENTDDYDDEGGVIEWWNGERLTYSDGAVDEDASTITLDAGPVAAGATADPVFVVDGGQIATDYTLFVSLGEGDEAELEIPFEQRPLWPEGEYADPVQVILSDDLEHIVEVPGRTPEINQTYIDVPTIKLHLATGTAPSIPHNTWTTVAGWTVRTANNFDVPMLDGWIPIAETGRYLAVGSHSWVANSTGTRSGRWVERRLDGTDAVLRVSAETPSAGGVASGQVIDSYFLEAGQAISFGVLQTSGAALSLADGPTQTGLLLVRMST